MFSGEDGLISEEVVKYSTDYVDPCLEFHRLRLREQTFDSRCVCWALWQWLFQDSTVDVLFRALHVEFDSVNSICE